MNIFDLSSGYLPYILGIVYVLVAFGVGATFFYRSLQVFNEPVTTELKFPDPPKGYIPASEAIFESIRTHTHESRAAILTGERGMGKSCFAWEVCRREAKLENPTLTPVFVALSQVRPTGDIASVLIDQVVDCLKGGDFGGRRSLAKSMIKRGQILFVLDDLDYVTEPVHQAIHAFRERCVQSVFLYIMTQKLSHSIYKNIAEVGLGAWSPAEVTEFICKRIPDESRRQELLRHLNTWGIMTQKKTRWFLSMIVDRFSEGRLSEILHPTGLEKRSDYRILESYLNAVLRRTQIESEKNNIGRISLDLLRKSQSTFRPGETSLSNTAAFKLVGTIFSYDDSRQEFRFDHSNYQLVLAGVYIASNWLTVSSDFDDIDARPLIWSALENCILQFVDEKHKDQVVKKFVALGTLPRVS